MRGSSLKSLKVFGGLVGADSFQNICLVTTMWDRVQERDVKAAESHEEELMEGFWKGLIDKGSITARSSGDRESALTILKRVAFDQNMLSTSGAPVAIQKELVDEHRTLAETSAGEALQRRMEEMQKEYNNELTLVRQESKKEKEDRAHMQQEIKILREQILQLKQQQSTDRSMEKDAGMYPPLNASIYVRFTSDELLGSDPPPPYEAPQAHAANSWRSMTDAASFIALPIIELHNFLQPLIGKIMRPRLRQGQSRIEWTCRCGELMYGDYLQRTPGSLQNLATKLGGRVTKGPAIYEAQGSQGFQPPQPPPPAHLSSSSTSNASSGAAAKSHNLQSSQASSPQPGVGGSTGTALATPPSNTSKWVELCIRSGPDTFILGEVDVAGAQTDRSLFTAIRTKYDMTRLGARLLGRFAYRTPFGGVAVAFRKDKFAKPTGEPATISVMSRPSMPGVSEAQLYKYVFEPMPMDEPPIDDRTFNHYFHNPDHADPAAKWITRLPQLHDSSLFYGNERLAKGWGIEITEKRNWIVFVCANIIALLTSGAVAGISAYYLQDNATGVAIGCWITAVQTLAISALFWRWTS